MDFDLTAEQKDLAGVVHQLASQRGDLDAVAKDPHAALENSWVELTESLGLAGLAIAEGHDGLGGSVLDVSVVAEQLGRSLFGPAFVVAGAVVPLLVAASDSEAAHGLLGDLAGNRRRAVSSLDPEPERGLTPARDERGRLRLSGSIPSVLALRSADVVVVPLGWQGQAGLAVVPLQGDGVSTTDAEAVDLGRPLMNVDLQDAIADWLPVDQARLGRARAGIMVVLGAELCGAARTAMEMAVAYAQQREQFDTPIGSYQAIQHLCADMFVAVEGAHACVNVAAWSLDAGATEAGELAAAALFNAREAAYRCAATNLQVHGAIAYTWEHHAHHVYRRAVSGRHSFIAPEELVSSLVRK